MKYEQLTEENLLEARMVWRKRGNKIVRAVRCTSGRRKGRVVATASQCSAPINMKKRITLKRNKAKFGNRMARKSQRTKKFNSASRRLRMLNR
jgi:hypothetical protein